MTRTCATAMRARSTHRQGSTRRNFWQRMRGNPFEVLGVWPYARRGRTVFRASARHANHTGIVGIYSGAQSFQAMRAQRLRVRKMFHDAYICSSFLLVLPVCLFCFFSLWVLKRLFLRPSFSTLALRGNNGCHRGYPNTGAGRVRRLVAWK